MKKKLLLFSTFLVIGVVLAGCTNQAEEEKSAADDANTPNQTQQEENEQESSQISVASILEKARNIDSSKYDLVTNVAGGEEQTITVWSKGDKMRTETTIEMAGRDLEGVYLLDREEEVSYAYMPAQNRAVRMDYSTTKEEVGDTPKNQSSELQTKDFEIIKEEVWDGKDCVVVKYVSEDGNETKTWIWKEYGLPVRFVNNTPQGEMITEIRNIDFSNINDSKLELPEGVQIIDVPTGLSY